MKNIDSHNLARLHRRACLCSIGSSELVQWAGILSIDYRAIGERCLG